MTEAEPALTVPDLLRVRALDDPEKTAIQQEDSTTLTFAQWETRSNAVAHALVAGGIRPGDRVGMTFGDHDWIDFAVCWTGAQKAGGVAVPVPARLAPVQAERMLEHCDAAALIGGVAPAGFGGWSAQPAELDGTAATPPDVRIDPADLAQILYTSGTTGTPKGVAASHANLTHGRRPRPRSRPYAHSRCFLHAFPIGTNAGQMMLLDTLVARPFALAAAGFDAERFCRLIAEHGAGTVFLVPAMAIDLLGSGALDRHDVSGVVLVSSSAAALPPAIAAGLARAFPAATIVNYYTSTEAVPARTTMIVDPERPASVGWAANGEDSFALLDGNYDATPASALKQSILAAMQFPLGGGGNNNGNPSFTLAPSAATLSVMAGSSATDTVSIADSGGFTGPVTLTASGMPTGVTVSFGTNPATSSSVVTVSAASTAAAGTFTLTISGNGTSSAGMPLAASTTIAVTVGGGNTGGGGACHIGYTITNQWTPGFQVALSIDNTSATAINGWTLSWTFANGQTVTQLWNGAETQSGSTVTVTNLNYNANIPAGGSYTGAGFLGTWSGTNAIPSGFKLNGAACSVN